jgi:catechol 2,3-dioxygenase-like lactoylglutathione lyase family enzyme
VIDHISVAVRDLVIAERFYTAVLAPLGLSKVRDLPDAAIGFGKKCPEFWINKREAMAPVADDSGVHNRRQHILQRHGSRLSHPFRPSKVHLEVAFRSERSPPRPHRTGRRGLCEGVLSLLRACTHKSGSMSASL